MNPNRERVWPPRPAFDPLLVVGRGVPFTSEEDPPSTSRIHLLHHVLHFTKPTSSTLDFFIASTYSTIPKPTLNLFYLSRSTCTILTQPVSAILTCFTSRPAQPNPTQPTHPHHPISANLSFCYPTPYSSCQMSPHSNFLPPILTQPHHAAPPHPSLHHHHQLSTTFHLISTPPPPPTRLVPSAGIF